MKQLEYLFGRLPVLKADKSPQLASFIGLAAGGIGLGLYFLSFIDALIPLALLLVLAAGPGAQIFGGELAVIAAVVLTAVYGYVRADESNRRRQAVVHN